MEFTIHFAVLERTKLMNLEGKVAVVTGGAYGIGRATAIALAKAGPTSTVATLRRTMKMVISLPNLVSFNVSAMSLMNRM